MANLLTASLLALPLGAAVATGWANRAAERAAPPLGRLVVVGPRLVHVIDRAADRPGGVAIVFVHGASGNARDPLLAFGSAFPHHRLLFVDRPGHGWSTRLGRGDSAPAVQAEVIAALLAEEGIGRAIVVGHSWGGSVAAAFGVGHPDKTAGLVFLAPATHPWPGGIDLLYRLTDTPLLGRLFGAAVVPGLGRLLLDDATARVFAPDPVPADYAGTIGATLLLRPDEWRANAEDIADLLANVTALQPHYREIRAPTLVVTGTRDPVVLREIHSAGLVRDIPGARLVELEGVGHMPHHAATARVVAEIERTIEAVEAAEAAAGRDMPPGT